MTRTLRFRAGDVARFVVARHRDSARYVGEVAAIETVGPFEPGQHVIAEGRAGRWLYRADYLIAFADGTFMGVCDYQLSRMPQAPVEEVAPAAEVAA